MLYKELVIFDTPRLHDDGNMWSHLAAIDLPTLHEFAARIGLRREWFQDKPGQPHYDIKTEGKRKLAAAYGAVAVDRKYLFSYLTIHYKLNLNGHNLTTNTLDTKATP